MYVCVSLCLSVCLYTEVMVLKGPGAEFRGLHSYTERQKNKG